jgi:NADH-quinone oxidoreductase subunit J
VYAALFFILTILSSAGMYLLLEAEFLAFALIIIYAGAILITYLFVIMLATEAPSEEAIEVLKDYDASANEPIGATAMGFALLGVLTGMFAFGIPSMPKPEGKNPDEILAQLPRKVQGAFQKAGLMDEGVLPLKPGPKGAAAVKDVEHSLYWIPAKTGQKWPGTAGHALLRTTRPKEFQARLDATRAVARGEEPPAHVRPFPPESLALFNPDAPIVLPDSVPDPARPDAFIAHGLVSVRFPEELRAANIELIGFALLREHPLSIELAGVVLLLAMVGAVILARKQIEAASPGAAGTIGATSVRTAA